MTNGEGMYKDKKGKWKSRVEREKKCRAGKKGRKTTN